MKKRTIEQRRNNRKFTMAEKIFMYTFSIITLLSVCGVIYGGLTLDNPGATPKVILLLSLGWLGLLTLLGNEEAEATHGKNR